MTRAFFGKSLAFCITSSSAFIEQVPVMLSIVQIVRRSRGWYEQNA
jgi:hypothetical protein